MMTGAGVQPLAWDSEWLGFPVARFEAGPAGTAAEVAAAVAWCRGAGIRLLYLVLSPAAVGAATAARAVGAALVDVKLTYAQAVVPTPVRLAGLPVGVSVAPAGALTRPLEELAWQSGEYSRFRRDARIGTRAFEELYTCWLGQTLERGIVWAASVAGEPVGLLAFDVRAGQASIELLAVAPQARRQHIGQYLVQAALDEARRRGQGALRVVTQGANQPARSFYERCGFRLRHTEPYYHLWL